MYALDSGRASKSFAASPFLNITMLSIFHWLRLVTIHFTMQLDWNYRPFSYRTQAPGRDNQSARARAAQEMGAAFELPNTDLSELPDIVEVLLNDAARNLMRENCRKLNRGGGAAQAANALARLLSLQLEI